MRRARLVGSSPQSLRLANECIDQCAIGLGDRLNDALARHRASKEPLHGFLPDGATDGKSNESAAGREPDPVCDLIDWSIPTGNDALSRVFFLSCDSGEYLVCPVGPLEPFQHPDCRVNPFRLELGN